MIPDFQKSLIRLMSRFRYPVSLPEEIACDLGLMIPNTIQCKDLIRFLSSPNLPPIKLKKYMPRFRAESHFRSPVKSESFPNRTLFSYYLGKGWVVVSLYYDDQALLRRVSLQFPKNLEDISLDLPLLEDSSFT